jgi:hypothetical protein
MSRRGEIKKTANSLEKKLAKELGMQRVPGSGMLAGWKGDIQSEEYLLDSKNTEKKVISLKSSDLSKITSEARDANRIGHLILTFLPDDHYAVVPAIDCDFESAEVEMSANKSKEISLSALRTIFKKCEKKKLVPSIKITFETICYGTPKDWLIIPINIYSKEFCGEQE